MSAASATPSAVTAPSMPIPTGVDAHAFLFSSHFKTLSNPFAGQHAQAGVYYNPDHTFDGRDVPPTRPALVDSASGAQISWGRLRDDSQRFAAGLIGITGSPLPWGDARIVKHKAVHSARTTLLIHLPNCLAFAPILLGGLRAHCTVCPISSLLAPAEIAYILAKARPRVIVTSRGPDGEGKILQAIEILASGEHPEFASEAADQWARDLRQHLASGNVDKEQRRIRTVSLYGGIDYYGLPSSDAAADASDWSHLVLRRPLHELSSILPSSELQEAEQAKRVALLLWSSGTTGLPKGVLLSHKAIIVGCLGNWLRPHETGPWRNGGERWIALAPWCHVFGLMAFLLSGVAQAAVMILPPPGRFDLKSYLRLLSDHRATFASIAPPIVVALRNTPLLDPKSPQYMRDLDLSDLKGFMAGGAPVAPDVIKDVWHKVGKYVQMGYGASETVGTHQCRALSMDEAAQFAELGSSGNMLHNGSMRIVPPSDLSAEEKKQRHEELLFESKAKEARGEAAPLKPCMPGEVQIKSAGMMLGYFSGLGCDEGEGASPVDQKLSAFTEDGWYRSGDEGVLDRRGNLWITGRTKETFKVKGFQVAPVELDSLFVKHPAVADVAAGSVHETNEGSDVAIIYVQPADASLVDASDSSQAHEKQRSLVAELAEWVTTKTAYYKWPRYYVFTSAVPKSPSGKILRKDLHKLQGVRHPAPKNVSKL